MKPIITLLIILSSYNLFGQKTEILAKPKVDQRVELMSLVFRLAECREYNSQRFANYAQGIESYFKAHKDHELMKYIKTIRRKRGIGFDAVMFMAISMSDSYPFKPLVPFSKEIPEQRWGKKAATQFLKLLNQFYVDANCAEFFKKNQTLYTQASERFTKVYNELDLSWYQKFYGEKPKGEFRIVNGLGNGGGNYGPKTLMDGKEIVYAIMGTWMVDDAGMPKYPIDNYFPTLLHEFNHSFVNHVVEKFHNQLANSGKIIFKPVKARMNAQAYGTWQTMYAEAIVRAGVIKYLQDHDYEPDFVQSRLNSEINRGFLWTAELVAELERYDNNRDKYPSLESFMPEIIKFFDQVAQNVGQLEKEVEKRTPKVVQIKPFKNGSQEVATSLNTIVVLFDQPLKGRGYSVNKGAKGKKAFPEIEEVTYSEDKKSVSIKLKLKPNKTYQFVLTGSYFKSVHGYGIKDYEINFKTKND